MYQVTKGTPVRAQPHTFANVIERLPVGERFEGELHANRHWVARSPSGYVERARVRQVKAGEAPVCSKRYCGRPAQDGYKWCAHCRTKDRQWLRKNRATYNAYQAGYLAARRAKE